MKTYRIIQFLLLMSIFFLQTCKEPEKQMLVSTGVVSNIGVYNADVSGKLLDLGEGVSSYGHCYATEPNVTASGTKTTINVPAAVGFSYTSILTGLLPSTKYYIKAYCSRGSETVYGDEISFTTLSDSKPEVSTDIITVFDKETAFLGGEVISQGGTPVTERGVCYDLATGPTIDNNKVQIGSGTGKFSKTIEQLQPDRKYYVRAYATNQGGTAYGNERSFTTLPDVPVPPTVTSDEPSQVTSLSAVCGGNVTAEGSSPVTAKGVCWGTNTTPTIEVNNKTNEGTGTGHFTSSITGLDPGTKYYVRAYATNSAGTSYGTEYSFTTSAVVPTLNTLPITSITASGASSGGNITSTGGASIIAKGVCWKTSPGPNIFDNKTENGIGPDDFISNLTNLQPGTKYYVRAYATNSVGPGYGNEVEFTTSVSPSVTTDDATSISKTAAQLNGTVNPNGQTTVVIFEYGITTGYGMTVNADQSPVTGIASTPVNAGLTGLSEGTIYHYRVKAVSSGGTSYGEDKMFTTLCNIASASVESATGITSTTATLNGYVNANGFPTIVTFEYGTTISFGSVKTAVQSPVSGNVQTAVSSSISGLIPNTAYYYRIKAENCGGIVYSTDTKSFTTNCTLPTARVVDPATLSSSSATLSGFVNPAGFSTVVTFEYGTTTSYGTPVLATQSPVGGSSEVSVSKYVYLTPNTAYHYRIKAENCGGIVFSGDKLFNTPCLQAAVTTGSATNVTDNSVTFNGTVNANNGSTTVTFEYGTTLSYGSSISATPGTVTGTSNLSVSAEKTGLTRNTLYHYRIKAVNCGGTSYGDDQTFTTPLCPGSLTVTHTAGTVAPVDKTVTYGVVETNLSGSNKCWITRNLGATYQASSATSSTETRGGWYWQFNRKQGYMHDGTTRTPATAWINTINEASNWLSTNDPCTILLGTGWRIPTLTEWTNVDTNGGWNNYYDTFASVLKLHAAGALGTDGVLVDRGGFGIYQTSTNWYDTNTRPLILDATMCYIGNTIKSTATPLRCIRD